MPSLQTSKGRRRWRARVKVNGTEVYLGDHATPEAAAAAEAEYRAAVVADGGVVNPRTGPRCTCPGGPWEWAGAPDPRCPTQADPAS